jgi:uncharacterized protein YndB with AHSA1/START domain
MQIERNTLVPGPPERVFALVDDLSAYPAWMDLVHEVAASSPTQDRRAWEVELQAQVGPFARSKRLRMVRTVHEPGRRVVFERAELDGRRHSAWILGATLEADAADEVDAAPGRSENVQTRLTMTLTYGGNLWTGAVLQRVLDDHVERGAAALCALLTDEHDAE